jgi:hypothetical protein
MFSSIQNAEFIVLGKPLETHFGFFGLLRPKSKIVFSSILQNDEPKPKFFGKNWELKTP